MLETRYDNRRLLLFGVIKGNTFLFCTVKKISSVLEPQNEKFNECSVIEMASISVVTYVVNGRVLDLADSGS